MSKGLASTDEDLVEDRRAQLHADIADLLATLSMAVDSPKEFNQSTSPFDAEDVDFLTDSWISRLLDVQGWLRFDEMLPASDAEAFVTVLVDALGLASNQEAVDHGSSVPALSVTALDRLRERAEKAVQLQRVFVEVFDTEGSTRNSATQAWIAGWEDEEESDDTAPAEPVSARADTWRISDFVGKRLNLTPSYQRGDVWRVGARQVLIESILRGIPLPSVILLRPSEATQPHEVVDGKQRLTTILRFVGKHPTALEKVREADSRHAGEGLLTLFADDYPKFRQAWKSLEHETLTSALEDEYYFPFRLRADDRGLAGERLAPLQGKYYTQIKSEIIRAADQDLPIQELFEGTPDYRIPVIVYSRASQRQIHEVFNLYNKQGMHLNAEEIRNAIFHDLQLTRATLVAAGDSDPRAELASIAPALEEVWPRVKLLQGNLSGYGFGASRYRRTKVLSWIIATLLADTQGDSFPSTAKHIDALLRQVQKTPSHPLRDERRITDLFSWIAEAAELHSGYSDLWSPEFRDGGAGLKWQELQLVGSFIGIAIALAGAPGDIEDRIVSAASHIYDASKSKRWTRPNKTQTKSQWEFIARIAGAVVKELDVDMLLASNEIKRRFGSSGVESLMAAIADAE